MKKLVLFVNGNLGLEILDYLSQRKDTQILAVVINNKQKCKPEYKSQVSNILFDAEVKTEVFQYYKGIWESAELNRILSFDTFGISALFGHIFPKNIIDKFNGNLINLHPSLLPIGRGADPVFWSIVEELPHGASIPRIEESIDTGEIFVQEELVIESWLNSGQIYELAMKKLYDLFIDFYPHWNASTPSTPQVGKGTYHQVCELDQIKAKMLDKPGMLFEQLNLIQALTYNDNRRARLILPNKEIWEVSLQLKRIQR